MLYHQDNGKHSNEAKKLRATIEILYTSADFLASVCFLAGSILFLFDQLQKPATWFFIVGSALFAAKPTLTFVRELKLAALGEDRELARRKD